MQRPLSESGDDNVAGYSFFGVAPTQSRKQGGAHDGDDDDGPPLENNNQLMNVCVCVDLVSGQRGPFPILELTKACWTCPPPLDA